MGSQRLVESAGFLLNFVSSPVAVLQHHRQSCGAVVGGLQIDENQALDNEIDDIVL